MSEDLGRPLLEADEFITHTRFKQRPREETVVAELLRLTQVPARLVPVLAGELQAETLVVAYRACVRNGFGDLQRCILDRLIQSIARYVHRALSFVPWRDSEERTDVEAELAARLVAEWGTENPATEFWEIRFWRCLQLRLIDCRRTVQKGVGKLAKLPEDENCIPNAADVSELEKIAVRVLMDQLPAEIRMVVMLKYVDGCTDAEIAARIGCSERTVRNMVQRARRAVAVLQEDSQ